MAKSPKYYVVWKGRRPGVYSTWAECQIQVIGYAGAKYKSFPTRDAAWVAYREGASEHISSGPKPGEAQDAPDPNQKRQGIIADSISVDAACSGNPGVLEYRGVETESRESIFHHGPFPEGTVNIGEFLAIVDGLRFLSEAGRVCPLYSDSQIALGWIAKKKCNTNLPRTRLNDPLFQRVEEAESWLKANRYETRLLKWETDRWGENPADFGRK